MPPAPTGAAGAALVFFLATLALPVPTVWGQEAVGPVLFAGREQPKKAAAARPPSLGLSLTPPVEAALPPLDPDELDRLRPHRGLTPIGTHRALPDGATALSFADGAAQTTVAGAWQATIAGRLWRLRVTSPGAYGLRIHFQDFNVGEGNVWVHGADGQVAGPYGGRGMYGDGDFWSDIVFGESATIEYLPAPQAPAEAAPFRIAAVSHQYARGFMGAGGVAKTASSLSAKNAAGCHLDASCYSDWSETATGVAHIVFERNGNSFACSGALLNDKVEDSYIPYFLTAAHCVNTDAAARSVIAYWRYQTETCNGFPPSRRNAPRTNGARLLTAMDGGLCTTDDGERAICADRGGDAALLQLAEDPPGGIWFLGWSTRHQSVGSAVTGIHHPDGSFKRISFGRVASQEHSFHIVSWSQGRTEPGSSGSPLFDGFDGSGVVLGLDSFSRRYDEQEDICLTNPDAGYMRFSDFYPHIHRYLEGENGNPTPPPSGSTVRVGVTSVSVGPPPPPGGAPRISSEGIVLATGTPVVSRAAPLALISVFGQDFAPAGTRELNPRLDSSGRIAANLGNTCLEYGGNRAPLFAVTPTQINAQATGQQIGSADIRVIRNCDTGSRQTSEPVRVEVGRTSPAFFNFESNSDGRNAIVALHGGGPGLAGPPGLIPGLELTPAEPGEVVTLFGTGFGQTDPWLEAGQIPARVLPNGVAGLVNDVSFTIGGGAVPPEDVLYAGTAPCCAGLYQFVLRVPQRASRGAAAVMATTGGVSTIEGPFLTIGGNLPPPPPPLNPGRRFRDCDVCPWMVEILAGSFLMGSPESEEGRYDSEGPVHRVTIGEPFAVGAYEVTFEEWDACVADGGCGGYRLNDFGYGRGMRPVLMSWEGAQAYVRWLSRKAEEKYRLLSEAEWEYAARAGTRTRYSFGDEITESDANYGENIGKTQRVGSYRENGYGLYDMHGNAAEWVQDCWNDSYRGAPNNGEAWETGDCFWRVLRGGSWLAPSRNLRSANRGSFVIGNRYFSTGFRVARTLRP